MRVLAVASQKGGSGKTTLSGHLAVQAQMAGNGPVVLIDIDPQGSLSEWWNERTADFPAFAQTTVARLQADLEVLRQQGFKLALIDTPPAITMGPDGRIANVFAYDLGNQGSIVAVRFMYVWPIQTSPLFDFSNIGKGRRLLMATSVAKSETYQ